jgi:hypothetical protein
MGALWRPFAGTQTAFFSSRGPNADGRIDPDVVASGFDNIGQGFFSTSELTIGSGTSFSAPIVSGIAAILRQAFPTASPIEIRNAIVASGNADAIRDGSTELDRGTGLVNAEVAHALLREHQVSERAGSISTDVSLSSSRSPRPKTTAQGEIEEGQLVLIPLDIPAGVQFVQFELSWTANWGNYPTNDIDLILYDPQLNPNAAGATLNLPEHVEVQNPAPGTWYALIRGFDLPAGTDKFRLSVRVDGKKLKK